MCSCWRKVGSLRAGLRNKLPPIHLLSRPIWAQAQRPASPRGVAMPEPLLSLNGVHAGYGGTEILRGLNFVLYPGEIVTVLGPNGAGKSTMSRTISGIVRSFRGTIHFHDAATEREAPASIMARGLIHVPEGR